MFDIEKKNRSRFSLKILALGVICLLLLVLVRFTHSAHVEDRVRVELTDDEIADHLESLKSIGYLGQVHESKGSGGSSSGSYPKSGATSGYRLCVSSSASEAVLFNANNKAVHKWARAFDDIWASHASVKKSIRRYWRNAFLLPDGHLLAIVDGLGVVELDENSKIVWKRLNGAHHGLAVLPNGEIVVICRRKRSAPQLLVGQDLFDDVLERLNRRGELLEAVSLLDSFENTKGVASWLELRKKFRSIERCSRSKRISSMKADPFHANSIVYVDNGAFIEKTGVSKGSFLISIRNLDSLVVLNTSTHKIEWIATGPFYEQHSAQIQEDGNILLYNNYGLNCRSEIQRIDPKNKEVVWRFGGGARQDFFSGGCGAVQSLGSNRFIVTVTEEWRAFEVDEYEKMVWHFDAPCGDVSKGYRTKYLFTMRHYPETYLKVSLQ